MKVKIGAFPKKGHRKINIQIDSWDTWNMDHTLAMVIYPMLLQLKNTKHGTPSEFVSDIGGEDYVAQESFDFYKETHDDAFKEGCKRWDETLDKMIWAFHQLIVDDYTKQYFHGERNFEFVQIDREYPNPSTGKLEPTYKMIDKNAPSNWFDSDGLALHESRIQEGLELFGRFYRSLWD